jgi:hypothetical protein
MKWSIQVLICLLASFISILAAETTTQPGNAEPDYYWFDGPNSRALLGPFGEWYGFFEEKTYPIGNAPDPHLWRTDVCFGPVHFGLPLSAPVSALVVLGFGAAVVLTALSICFKPGARTKPHEASNA